MKNLTNRTQQTLPSTLILSAATYAQRGFRAWLAEAEANEALEDANIAAQIAALQAQVAELDAQN